MVTLPPSIPLRSELLHEGSQRSTFYGAPLTPARSYVDLIVQVIAPVIRDQSAFVEVNAESEKEYNMTLHEAIRKTIFNNSCSSVSRKALAVCFGGLSSVSHAILLAVFHRPGDAEELVHLSMELFRHVVRYALEKFK